MGLNLIEINLELHFDQFWYWIFVDLTVGKNWFIIRNKVFHYWLFSICYASFLSINCLTFSNKFIYLIWRINDNFLMSKIEIYCLLLIYINEIQCRSVCHSVCLSVILSFCLFHSEDFNFKVICKIFFNLLEQVLGSVLVISEFKYLK